MVGFSAGALFFHFGAADEIVYVRREYSRGCMLERNRCLVDRTACLLAVYNDERRGGTAMTVRCAQRLGRKIIVLDPRMGQINKPV